MVTLHNKLHLFSPVHVMSSEDVKCSEYWNVAVDLGPMPLRNTLGYPDDIAAFLFLQFDVRVEHSELELQHE